MFFSEVKDISRIPKIKLGIQQQYLCVLGLISDKKCQFCALYPPWTAVAHT